MKRMVFIAMLMVLVSGLVLVGCAKQPATTLTATSTATQTQPVKPIKWLFTSHIGLNSGTTHFTHNWCEAVKQKTNGRLTFELYWSESFAPAAQALTQVKSGLADWTFLNNGLFQGQLPLTQIMAQPFFWPVQWDLAQLALDRAILTSPDLQAELNSSNCVFGFSGLTAPKDISGKIPIRTVDDFKGKKIRNASAAEGEIFTKFGAVTVNMPLSDMYNALGSGLVDLVGNGKSSLYSYRLAEIAKYLIFLKYSGGNSMNVFNKDSWNALPSDIKTILEGLRVEADKWVWYWSSDSLPNGDEFQVKTWDDMIKGNGVDYFTFPDSERAKMVAKSADIWADWVAKNSAGAAKAQTWMNLCQSEIKKALAEYPNGLGKANILYWPTGWPNHVDRGWPA